MTRKHRHADSGAFTCTPAQSRAQAAAFIQAKQKNWRFTSCPEAAWLHLLPTIWKPHQLTLVDIGCNKARPGAFDSCAGYSVVRGVWVSV